MQLRNSSVDCVTTWLYNYIIQLSTLFDVFNFNYAILNNNLRIQLGGQIGDEANYALRGQNEFRLHSALGSPQGSVRVALLPRWH